MWKISWEYKYSEEIVNGTLDYYVARGYCGASPPGFDFIFKYKPNVVFLIKEC